MIVQRPKSLPLVAAHDRGIARDIAEHDRGKLAGRTRARRPARIGHLRFPALFHAKVSRRWEAEHLGPSVALFKKGVPFSWLSSGSSDARGQIFADLHLSVDGLAQATNA